MKIKRIVFVVILLFSLIPLQAFGLFMIYENDQRIESVMRENLAAISGTQILDITNFCRSRKEKLEIISQLNMVHDVLASASLGEDTGDRRELAYLTNMLEEWQQYGQYVESLSIIGKDFSVIASSSPFDPNARSKLGETEAQFLDGSFYISNIIERQDGAQTLKTVAAVLGILEDGEIIGYVVEEISPSFFEQNWTDTNLWNNGTLYLLDGNDTLITAGMPGESSRDTFVTTAEERKNYQQAWDALDRKANPSGEFSYTIGGVTYITYYSDIEYTNWSLRITVNLSGYQDSKNEYRVLLLLSGGVLSLLIILMNILLTKRLTHPIDRIASTLKRIQDGQDYTLRVEKCGKDELGELAGKINLLLDYIEDQNLQEKEAQRSLSRMARLDTLTGVRNKSTIEEYLLDALQRLEEDGKMVAVGFVDVDDFKNYNTAYGHQEGDRVLRFVASVLEQGSGGAVGRIGGDEFLFVVTDAGSRAEMEARSDRIVGNLRAGVAIQETGETVPVPCSIGVVLVRQSDLSYNQILRSADLAMYEVKHAGKDGWRLIDLDADHMGAYNEPPL